MGTDVRFFNHATTLLLSHRSKLPTAAVKMRSVLEFVARWAPMIGENLVNCASGLFCFKGAALQMPCKGDQSLPQGPTAPARPGRGSADEKPVPNAIMTPIWSPEAIADLVALRAQFHVRLSAA
jgi:hypothetical protein